ncbi:restriction endonuclease [Streptomyces badius]
MAIPIRRRRGDRQGRASFDLRRTSFGFALLALLVAGGGLALRAVWESAARHPAFAVIVVLSLPALAVLLLRRRRARRVAAAVTEAAYDIVDEGLAELDAAEAARAEVPPPPPEPADRPVDYARLDPYAFEPSPADGSARAPRGPRPPAQPDAEVSGP